jgi:hypothetical protein
MPDNPKPEVKQLAISFYVLLAAALFVFIETFTLLSPILLSLLVTEDLIGPKNAQPVRARTTTRVAATSPPLGLFSHPSTIACAKSPD